MKKFYNAIIVLIAFHSNTIISQDVEEVVLLHWLTQLKLQIHYM